jgi:hypothetical protein
MPPFIYRCPNTGFQVQGFAPNDDVSEGPTMSLWASPAWRADRCTSSIRKRARGQAKVASSFEASKLVEACAGADRGITWRCQKRNGGSANGRSTASGVPTLNIAIEIIRGCERITASVGLIPRFVNVRMHGIVNGSAKDAPILNIASVGIHVSVSGTVNG